MIDSLRIHLLCVDFGITVKKDCSKKFDLNENFLCYKMSQKIWLFPISEKVKFKLRAFPDEYHSDARDIKRCLETEDYKKVGGWNWSCSSHWKRKCKEVSTQKTSLFGLKKLPSMTSGAMYSVVPDLRKVREYSSIVMEFLSFQIPWILLYVHDIPRWRNFRPPKKGDHS